MRSFLSLPLLALLPLTTAQTALTDLANLRLIINNAASTIGSPTNASRNWGTWPAARPQDGQLNTADTIMNITMTILFANYNMGVNLTRWLTVETPTNSTTPSAPYGSTYHNSTTPGSNTTKPVNLTETGLDGPYLDYISTIPNLSVALVAQGRSWHAELNRPVSNAIDLLQLSINEFSSSLLQIQPPLLTSRSTIRTIRAGSSLESAQRAWGRILNLPSGDQQNRQPDAEDQFLAPPSNAPVTSPGRVSIAGRVNVKRKRMDREALERRNRLKGLKAHEELWAP